MSMTFQELMDRQRELQLAFGGSDPRTRSPEEIANYLREMVLACTSELHEALDETKWKTWTSSGIGEMNVPGFKSELIDVLQFWMNLAALVSMTESEIIELMYRKHQKNYARLASGTNGLNKCWVCKRALDDEYVECTDEKCAQVPA